MRVRAITLAFALMAGGVGATGAGTGLSGCQRGCLTTWIKERQAGGGAPEGEGNRPGGDLGGTDCSDGLLRCIEGTVEASRIGHIPHPCGAPGDRARCVCPWETVARCDRGCVADHLEVIAPDTAATQLCRADRPITRPTLPTDVGLSDICASEGIVCRDDVVRVCERVGLPNRPLGTCLHGCSLHIDVDHGETKDLDGALAILCRHDDAERR